MTHLTDLERTTLARMSDGEWHRGQSLPPKSAGPLLRLETRQMIRSAGDAFTALEDHWTITPDGLAALEVTA